MVRNQLPAQGIKPANTAFDRKKSSFSRNDNYTYKEPLMNLIKTCLTVNHRSVRFALQSLATNQLNLFFSLQVYLRCLWLVNKNGMIAFQVGVGEL